MDSVERTKRREVAARAEAEWAASAASREAQAEEEARRNNLEVRARRADAKRQRIETLAAAKEAQRIAEAQRVRRCMELGDISFAAAVEQRKVAERELRAMAREEHDTRAEVARRDKIVTGLEAHRTREIEAAAKQCAVEANEARRMCVEDEIASSVRAEAKEAEEGRMMLLEDDASRAAAAMWEAEVWAQKVRRNRDFAREERSISLRETARMEACDAEARSCRREEKAQQAIAEAALRQREMVLAEAAKAEKLRLACLAAAQRAQHELEEEQRELCRACMQEEDRQSRRREEHDHDRAATLSWEVAVANRKREEHVLRAAQEEETARMIVEDALAEAGRATLREMERQRARDRADVELAAAAEVASRAAGAEARRRAFLEVEYARLCEELNLESLERQIMAAEDDAGQGRRKAESGEKFRLDQEQREAHELQAMSREDQYSRRLAVMHTSYLKQQELEYQRRKAEHARERRRQLAVEVEQAEEVARAREHQAGSEEELLERDFFASAQEERVHGQAAEAAATCAALERRKVNEDFRRQEALLAEERRTFEALYKRNRRFVAASRHGELSAEFTHDPRVHDERADEAAPAVRHQEPTLNTTEHSTGAAGRMEGSGSRDMFAASIASGNLLALAQTLSATADMREMFTAIDETATFFTES